MVFSVMLSTVKSFIEGTRAFEGSMISFCDLSLDELMVKLRCSADQKKNEYDDERESRRLEGKDTMLRPLAV